MIIINISQIWSPVLMGIGVGLLTWGILSCFEDEKGTNNDEKEQ